ncbi:MAG: hypothetical protein H7X92_02885 [Chitinophagales bacterium]|nr:hypothetical protein [Hyphomicrobiales bacterium]
MRTIIVHVQNTDEAEQPEAQIKRFIKLFAQKARLDAERLGSAEVIFPVGFEMASNRAQTVAEAERRVFLAKRAADENHKAQYLKRIEQFQKEIEGLRSQRKAKLNELELIRRELKLVDNLYKKNLTNEVRLIGMQRDLARFEGEDGALVSQIARVEAQVHEVQLQVQGIDTSTALDAEKALRDIESELGELIEQRAQTESTTAKGSNRGAQDADIIHISAYPLRERQPAPMVRTSYKPSAKVEPLEESYGATTVVPDGKLRKQTHSRPAYRTRRASGYRYRSPGYRISRVARRIFRLGL